MACGIVVLLRLQCKWKEDHVSQGVAPRVETLGLPERGESFEIKGEGRVGREQDLRL